MRHRDPDVSSGGARAGLAIAVLWQSACTAGVGVDLSIIDGPRVLAIAATPAEAQPGDDVELTAL